MIDLKNIINEIDAVNNDFNKNYPGDSTERQPIHVVYGGAHLFKSDTIKKLSELSLKSLNEYAPNSAILSKIFDLEENKNLSDDFDKLLLINDEELSYSSLIYKHLKNKLLNEAVEDFRIDFEDGYGVRTDEEEDFHAIQSAKETAIAFSENSLPYYFGFRIKPFSEELKERSLRTLYLFIKTLTESTNGAVPERFIITLPKLISPKQAGILNKTLSLIEKEVGLKENTFLIEVMIETPQILIDNSGKIPFSEIIKESEGRLVAAHFGVYDYSSLLNITSQFQSMKHNVCDLARGIMQIGFAGTAVRLSDGATNLIPSPPHRSKDFVLTEQQLIENRNTVHRAWKVGFENITHSLKNGFYQGWDLHPAQFISRYTAVYNYFLLSYDSTLKRLSKFIEQAAQATLQHDQFDDAATGQGLLNFFIQGYNCGAFTLDEILKTGLNEVELKSKSIVSIVKNRIGKKV